jgi:dienelactone hydrolase
LLAVTDETPRDVRVERRWQLDGIDGEELTWQTGFGPRTSAWLLRPSGATGPLPGVVALHSHDGFKFYGKEKIADSSDPTPPSVINLRATTYAGQAFANRLCRLGFVVLVPDVFCFGSRRFPIEAIPEPMRRSGPDEVTAYNQTAVDHEHLVEKYCRLLGTTLAAQVNREDRIALAYLRSRPEVGDRIGCIGLSGGGCRAALLQATSDVSASVIVGMMSTYDGLLDRHVASHTWMFFPAGLPADTDWSDLAACRAPSPLLVQYNTEDPLFDLNAAEAAHERITFHYSADPDRYVGEFYSGPHKFDLQMQDDAFSWLTDQLV